MHLDVHYGGPSVNIDIDYKCTDIDTDRRVGTILNVGDAKPTFIQIYIHFKIM